MDKQKIVLLVSIGCGLVAAFLFWNNSHKTKGREYTLVVSQVELLQGTVLREDMLSLSAPIVLEDASDFFLNISDAVGLKAKQPIPAGKAIRRSLVQDPSAVDTGSLKVAIPAGMIVVTFTNKDLENPPAFLNVGNYVDVLGYASKGANSQTLVVQSIQIVDLERNKDESFKSLSVAMTPMEAEAVAGATKMGQIRLALRLEPLIKAPQPYGVKVKPPTLRSMEVIRGATSPVQTVFGTPGAPGAPGGPTGTQPSQVPSYSTPVPQVPISADPSSGLPTAPGKNNS